MWWVILSKWSMPQSDRKNNKCWGVTPLIQNQDPHLTYSNFNSGVLLCGTGTFVPRQVPGLRGDCYFCTLYSYSTAYEAEGTLRYGPMYLTSVVSCQCAWVPYNKLCLLLTRSRVWNSLASSSIWKIYLYLIIELVIVRSQFRKKNLSAYNFFPIYSSVQPLCYSRPDL